MKKFIKKSTISILFAMFAALSIFNPATAQDTKFREQAWRFGLNLAIQSNSGCLGWQQLYQSDFNFHSPQDDIDLVDGTGWGPYIGIFGEYFSESWWGIQVRISYDSRNALVIDDTRLPIPSFDTKMSYLTIEPLFRIDQHVIPNLNFYAGPVIAINLTSTFDYKIDENKSETISDIDVKDVNNLTYGLMGGFAYDIKFYDFDYRTSLYVSPFFDCSWLANQKKSVNATDQNSVNDVWSTLSYRLGVRLSYEHENGSLIDSNQRVYMIMPPDNTILTKQVTGYFPIHPYVFFDKGSQNIPPRYILLTKEEVQTFNEAELENFKKGEMTVKETNVNQLMTTYYNNINIYGDRMRKNPNENLTLVASDPDANNADASALVIKDYLVNSFGIDSNRIKISISAPKTPSGTAYTEPVSKKLIDDENRRVTFVFNDAKMTKPLPYTIRDESSINNDIIFSIAKTEALKSWDLTITGEDREMYYGPFYSYSERINPAEIMSNLESGKYKAKVVVTDIDGKITEEIIPFKLSKEKEVKNASRYLMIFEYNQSDAIASYETKIRNEIVPGILPTDNVVIHGHTDVIGTAEGNRILAQERADQAKRIIEDQLEKENKTVPVEALGIGQTINPYTFNNQYPEGRMYNRNIFVEVIK